MKMTWDACGEVVFFKTYYPRLTDLKAFSPEVQSFVKSLEDTVKTKLDETDINAGYWCDVRYSLVRYSLCSFFALSWVWYDTCKQINGNA